MVIPRHPVFATSSRGKPSKSRPAPSYAPLETGERQSHENEYTLALSANNMANRSGPSVGGIVKFYRTSEFHHYLNSRSQLPQAI
jgi:hypothetical protein